MNSTVAELLDLHWKNWLHNGEICFSNIVSILPKFKQSYGGKIFHSSKGYYNITYFHQGIYFL